MPGEFQSPDGSEFQAPEAEQQVPEQQEAVETSPDIHNILSNAYVKLEQGIQSMEPMPDESARDFKRRVVQLVIKQGLETTSVYPPKPNQYESQFK